MLHGRAARTPAALGRTKRTGGRLLAERHHLPSRGVGVEVPAKSVASPIEGTIPDPAPALAHGEGDAILPRQLGVLRGDPRGILVVDDDAEPVVHEIPGL